MAIKEFFKKLQTNLYQPIFFTSLESGQPWIRQRIIESEKKVFEIIQSSSIFFPDYEEKSYRHYDVMKPPAFLWVGRLDRNKDPLTVVTAFIEFLRYVPTAKLQMIFQDGDLLPEIESTINASQRGADAILLVGKVKHHTLGEYFRSADFIISGSHYEGSGISVIEAMSCGCIPVVTNIASFRKMTNNGEVGFLYEPGDVKGLLETLLKTTKIDRQMQQEKVCFRFQEELSFEAIARKTNEVVNGLFKH